MQRIVKDWREKKIIFKLVESIKWSDNIDLRLSIENKYVLPYLWKGFKLRPGFTYRIENLKDLDAVWNETSDALRNNIRKAQKN